MLAEHLARRLSAAAVRTGARRESHSTTTTDDEGPPMTRATLVHDPVAGDRVEVFLRVTDIWMIVDDALRHLQDLGELKEVRAVHECLDPLGMPDGPDGPVWSVPPEPMWRLVERRRGASGPGRWLTEAVDRVRAILLEEFPELAATDHVDGALDDARATAAVVAQLGGTAVSDA